MKDETGTPNSTPRRPWMRRRLAIAAAAVAAAVAIAVPTLAAAGIGDDDENERPITGDALTRATAAALEHMGQGRVTDTEVEDEESYYEVEVTLDDGRQVDVQLDEDFNVVSESPDEEKD